MNTHAFSKTRAEVKTNGLERPSSEVTVSLWTSCPFAGSRISRRKGARSVIIFIFHAGEESASGSKWLDTAGIFWSELGVG